MKALRLFLVNNRGVAVILMKVSVHKITVACPGFATYTGIVKTDSGVKHRVKIELVKETVTAAHTVIAFTSETALEQ